ncbi:MAG: T9SS type A sorting domain-containing protein [Saprospiraceae bacterium]|nr:T9SS type A sorting domain-containing protein [Saprospiraceae bacterium]
MDARGQIVLRSKLSGAETSVQLDGLGSGAYFYQVLDGNNRQVGNGKLLIVNQ